MDSNRDATIDVLRGLAIFTMVGANLASEVLAEPHPFWFRLYGSFTAPLFIFVSGMMVASAVKSFFQPYFSSMGKSALAQSSQPPFRA